MKGKIVRIILSTLSLAVVSQLVNTAVSFATMSFYTDSRYFCVWSKLMMPKAGPPPAEFFYFSIGLSLVTALIFTIFYRLLKDKLNGGVFKKGLFYGLMAVLVSAVPGYVSLYMLINLPLGIILAWTASSILIYLVNGIVVAAINKK